MANKRILTDEQESRLAELAAAGLTDVEIGGEFGLPPESIKRVRQRLGIAGRQTTGKNIPPEMLADKERLLKAKADDAEYRAEISRMDVAEKHQKLLPVDKLHSILERVAERIANWARGFQSRRPEEGAEIENLHTVLVEIEREIHAAKLEHVARAESETAEAVEINRRVCRKRNSNPRRAAPGSKIQSKSPALYERIPKVP